MAVVFCTFAQVGFDAGKGRETTDMIQAVVENFINEAEAEINVLTGHNFSDTYGALNVDTKLILQSTASVKAAMKWVKYDMSGYADLAEAQTLLDVLYTIFSDNIKLLKEKQYSDFITTSGA